LITNSLLRHRGHLGCLVFLTIIGYFRGKTEDLLVMKLRDGYFTHHFLNATKISCSEREVLDWTSANLLHLSSNSQ